MTEKEIEQMNDGNVAYAAYYMRKYNASSRKWAKQQIEKGIGNVAYAAYCMTRHCD